MIKAKNYCSNSKNFTKNTNGEEFYAYKTILLKLEKKENKEKVLAQLIFQM